MVDAGIGGKEKRFMKKEDIVKAAKEYRETLPYCDDAKIRGMSVGGEIGFIAGVEWFMKSLFHKTKDEVPQPIGDYANEVYPQIPCLVKGHLSTGYGYGVRYWNVTEQCWDDEECDDYECDKDAVEEWAYLDDITGNMEE